MNKISAFIIVLFVSASISYSQNILESIDWDPDPWSIDDGKTALENLNSLLDHLVLEAREDENLWFLDVHFSSVKLLANAYTPEEAKLEAMIQAYSNYDSEGSMEKYIHGAKQLIIAYEFKPGVVSYVVATLPQGWDPRVSYPLYVWGTEGGLLAGYPQAIYNLFDEQISGGLLYRAPSSRFKDGYSIVPGGLSQGSYTGDCAADFIHGIDTFAAVFKTDRSKYYLGGFSAGGRATWYISTAEGVMEKFNFAGLALYAPNVDAPYLTETYSSRVADVPIWIGYGELDGIYGGKAQDLRDHLLSVGHEPEVVIEYKDIAHTWTQTIQGEMYYFLSEKQRILPGEIPAAPSNLEELVAEERRIEITWDDNDDNELYFSIQRKDLGQEEFKEISKVAPDLEYYIDTTVISGNRYTYRVTACNESGNSDFSNELSISTAGITQWNCALGKMISASNESYEGNSFSLIDGYTTNTEMYRWNATGFPQYVELDLYADHDISILKLYAYDNREYLYTIEAKTSDGEYVLLVDRSEFNKSAPVYVDLVDVQARYIKLTITGALIYSGNSINIAELEVYGRMINQIEVAGINIDSDLSLGIGETYKLSVAYTPTNATIKNVYWESSDTSIVKVDDRGNVLAVSSGTAKVIVTSKDGLRTDECQVIVSPSGIAFTGMKTAMNIFPNPISDRVLFFEMPIQEESEIQIMDINGKLHLSGVMMKGESSLSLSKLDAGIFYLRMSSDSYTSVNKFIVQ